MLATLIITIVVILVITGIMITATTGASGGVDQTKATKVLSELGTLAQNIGFYKATTEANDYAGISVSALQAQGIVNSNDVLTITDATSGYYYADGTAVDGTTTAVNVIKSKALPELAYIVQATDLDGDGNADNTSTFEVRVVAKTANIAATLKSAVENAILKKLGDKVVTASNNAQNDAAVDLVFD